MKTEFTPGKTWVIKVGSSLLTNHGAGIDRSLVQGWVDDIAALKKGGARVVDGEVSQGMNAWLSERPIPYTCCRPQRRSADGACRAV